LNSQQTEATPGLIRTMAIRLLLRRGHHCLDGQIQRIGNLWPFRNVALPLTLSDTTLDVISIHAVPRP